MGCKGIKTPWNSQNELKNRKWADLMDLGDFGPPSEAFLISEALA
jgi:hypothetical protein